MAWSSYPVDSAHARELRGEEWNPPKTAETRDPQPDLVDIGSVFDGLARQSWVRKPDYDTVAKASTILTMAFILKADREVIPADCCVVKSRSMTVESAFIIGDAWALVHHLKFTSSSAAQSFVKQSQNGVFPMKVTGYPSVNSHDISRAQAQANKSRPPRNPHGVACTLL